MKTADIHSQLQALISSCIDEGDYDPAEDYIKDPFCRRTMHAASLAIEEIDALRARVAELEADNADFKKLIADELAETFRLFGAVGLNEADDFGTKTAIEAVRERIESIKADRDRWKTEALAARPFIDMGCIEAWQPDGFHPGIPTHIAYKAARAANEEVPHD